MSAYTQRGEGRHLDTVFYVWVNEYLDRQINIWIDRWITGCYMLQLHFLTADRIPIKLWIGDGSQVVAVVY